jgi:nucleoside-diphosphate-sugar epimerase
MARFTVLGASGFVGSTLVDHLRRRSHDVVAPARGEAVSREPGHLVYCVGVTADFRMRPHDTVTAHISYLADIVGRVRPLSFLYLSSTRVYQGSESGEESAPLALRPANPEDLYNATKIAGEALCLAQPSETVRVARLSNVFGPGMDTQIRPRHDFLAAVIRDAVRTGKVTLRTTLDSEKDYIGVEDVVRAIERIALKGQHRLYNLASGHNVTHRDILERITAITGCHVTVEPGSRRIYYPPIDTQRLASEFYDNDPWTPSSLLDRMPELVAAARDGMARQELAS